MGVSLSVAHVAGLIVIGALALLVLLNMGFRSFSVGVD